MVSSPDSSISDAAPGNDIDKQRENAPPPPKVRHWHLVISQSLVTDAVLNHQYMGSGTDEDPYVVEFIPNDPRDPMNFPDWKKWKFIVLAVAIATLAVAFVSTAYTGAIGEVIKEFHISSEVAILGVSLFVLGFALGPLVWAPLSELYGRQILFIGTYIVLTAMNAGAAGAHSIATLLVLRFLAGTFGASPLTNAGGVVADILPASQRGLGMALFSSAPFFGPVIGPIIGGFMGETVGWRWVEGVMAIFTGVLLIIGTLTIPETYAPTILDRRAKALSKKTGLKYISVMEKRQGKLTAKAAFSKALSRPWALLFVEPIVLILTIYAAIIYGTLYMMFTAFPIVFQEKRGWSQGIGGLAFLGVAVGVVLAVIYNIFDNKRYVRVQQSCGGEAPPESRLPPAIIASVCIPIGIFWFAWTNSPSVHWIVSIIGSGFFGFGIVMIFLAIMNYLIDSYTIYAASVLAANSVLRSLFGAAFPLFTTYMYDNLGIHWASSIPGFLALACMPFPFLFWKYGEKIRMKLKVTKPMDSPSSIDHTLASLTNSSSGAGNGEKSEMGITSSETQSDNWQVEMGEGSSFPDDTLANKSCDELIEIIKYLRLKSHAQQVHLEHLEHQMKELNEDKNQAAAAAREHAMREEEYSDILVSLGEHPSEKVQLHDVNREQCTEFDRNAPLDPSPADLEALTGFDFRLKLFKYDEKPKMTNGLDKTHYHEIAAIMLDIGHLKSYYRLGNLILQEADAQRRDMNVIVALQLAPKLEKRPYLRVLHPSQFSTWVKKMALLKPSLYELHAYLYTDAEAEQAYGRLEFDTRILKY
ncbi:hypothetical protein DV735_g1473, partial [Chaetothyriales sp. CBS 134920]